MITSFPIIVFYDSYYDIYTQSGAAFGYAVTNLTEIYQPGIVVNTDILVDPSLKVPCKPDEWEKPKSAIGTETASFDENSSEDMISIYPNPATDQLNIQWNTDNEEEMILIFDPSGKLVYSNLFRNHEMVTIDVSEWNSGVYFLRIQSGEILKQLRFVVQ